MCLTKDDVFATIPKYNGSGDPIEYCSIFEEAMNHPLLRRKKHGILFGLLLEGHASTWYEYFSTTYGYSWQPMKHSFIQSFQDNPSHP